MVLTNSTVMTREIGTMFWKRMREELPEQNVSLTLNVGEEEPANSPKSDQGVKNRRRRRLSSRFVKDS